MDHSEATWTWDLSSGVPATIWLQMPHSLCPLLILKQPLSPQPSFQELATNQQGLPDSTPQPTILMAWPPRADPVLCWYTPDLQVMKSSQTVKAASTGPWVMISVWIFCTSEGTEQAELTLHLSWVQVLPFTHDFLQAGVGWDLPQGPQVPLTWWSQGAKAQGWHHLLSLQSHPVTAPSFLNQFQAPEGQPPLQPLPQVRPQQVRRSSEEILVWRVWLLAMQILSLRASTAPKAQQDPQVLWSLTSLRDSHLGQFSAEEKFSGMSALGVISLRGSLR